MDESLNSGSARLDRQLLRRLHVHGMECLLSALDVKTDRIHHTVSPGKRIGDRPPVVEVGFDGSKLPVIDIERHAGSMRMPRYDPKGKFARAQVLNDAPAEKPGSTENSDGASSHGAAC